MAWRTVAAGAVVGVAATRLLMSRSEAPYASHHQSHPHHSVSFAADGLPKHSRTAIPGDSALLPAAAAAAADAARRGQHQAVSWRQRRWAIEAQLLALQMVLAAVATYTADRLHGRGLAQHVLLASAFLIGGLLVLSLLAAAVSAAWQSWQRSGRPRRGQQEAEKAAALAEALLAEVGGPRAALAEARPPVAQNFSGTWDKDKAASDSMEPAMEAMRLNMLVRRGVSLVRGLIIKQDETDFEMAVFSAVPWFKVVERYPLSGEERHYKRRDLRRGKHVGHAEVLPDGRVRLHVAWGDPIGGVGHDTFSCPAAGVLHVDTIMGIKGRQTMEYRSVYRRRA